jgi:hypothetical protein
MFQNERLKILRKFFLESLLEDIIKDYQILLFSSPNSTPESRAMKWWGWVWK